MKKNNGFTLIELLAVILILGIIALIAIPAVTKIIKESKKEAFETAAINIVGAIEDACELQLLKGETITTTYTFTEGTVSPALNVKGKLPTSGTVTVDANCRVTLNATNGTFTVTKNALEDSIIIVDGGDLEEPTYSIYTNGTAVYFNPETGDKCTSGEAVSTTGTKTGCMKWYIFNDGGSTSQNVNMILDHNTTAGVVWNSSGTNIYGPNEVLTQLQTDTSSWAGVQTRTDSYTASKVVEAYFIIDYTINYSNSKARLITANEIAIITGNITFEELITKSPFGIETYGWLFENTSSCESHGCSVSQSGVHGYWTSTACTQFFTGAWIIQNSASLAPDMVDYGAYSSFYGVRPVITISKLKL